MVPRLFILKIWLFVSRLTGIQNGHKIVEIGTGSGIDKLVLSASIVKPRGHVHYL